METRKRNGIVDIIIGSLMIAFFLFGLGIAWLIPALIADPPKLIEILRRLSAGEIVLFGFVVFLFFLGLFTIYRGVSILTGWRFSDRVRAFFHDVKDVVEETNPPDNGIGKAGGSKTKGEP